MKKTNYHMHTTISDGVYSPEELIKLAIKKKFSEIAITDHYGFPKDFDPGWDSKSYSIQDYNLLKKLQKKYKNKIKILVGAEFEWLEDYKQFIKKHAFLQKYDLKLISVHFIKLGEEYFSLYNEKKLMQKAVKKYGIKKIVKKYYKELRNACKTEWFGVVAHLDLIKIWNKKNKYFNDSESWYKKEIIKTLKVIKKTDMEIDLNTSGLRRDCKEQYPAKWIVQIAKEMKIPLLIGTDCHDKGHIDSGIKEAQKLLK